MKKLYILTLLLLFDSVLIYAADKTEKRQELTTRTFKKKYHFNFINKKLAEIIEELAAKKKINILFPQGALAAEFNKITVTYREPNPVPLNQAWQQLITLLEATGYTLRPEGTMTMVVKIDPNVNRQPFEIFINEPVDALPDTDDIIRAVFYLKNINLKQSWNDINGMLKDMLSTTANIQKDDKTNALLLTDKASNIKAVMKIIHELDEGGFRDSIEVLPLYYTSAELVDNLFNKQLLAQRQQAGASPPAPGQEQQSYFPKTTKILGLPRTNSLVIMGTTHAIDLVKDFIIKYIDRPLESGESILHVYELQYLNAQEFAPILQQIVTPAQQAQATGVVATGPKQYFKGVIIQAEKISKTEQISPTQVAGTKVTTGSPTTEGAQLGGNRLIIAARKKDWIRIKKLIEELDKPQPQIAIEVLVVDLNLSRNKLLGSQTRNREGFNDSLFKNTNYQSAQLVSPILKDPVQDQDDFRSRTLPPDALMANLLQITGFGETGLALNLATGFTPGSLVFSLKDTDATGVWSVWQVLNNYTNSTILAQPFIVTKNHKQATVSIAQKRLLPFSADTSNVSPKITFKDATAALTVDILPHISRTNNINLQITVNVNEFVGEDINNKISRIVQTNANVGDGEILALGGLTRARDNIDQNETPLLGKIPVVGWFFKKRQKVKEKNNLAIFISPTIIEPRVNGGVDPFTAKKLGLAECNIQEHVSFENLRDPISRWFFEPDPCLGKRTIEEYKEHTQAPYDHGEAPHLGRSASYDSAGCTDDSMVIIDGKELPATYVNAGDPCCAQATELKDLLKDEQNPLLALQSTDH